MSEIYLCIKIHVKKPFLFPPYFTFLGHFCHFQWYFFPKHWYISERAPLWQQVCFSLSITHMHICITRSSSRSRSATSRDNTKQSTLSEFTSLCNFHMTRHVSVSDAQVVSPLRRSSMFRTVSHPKQKSFQT